MRSSLELYLGRPYHSEEESIMETLVKEALDLSNLPIQSWWTVACLHMSSSVCSPLVRPGRPAEEAPGIAKQQSDGILSSSSQDSSRANPNLEERSIVETLVTLVLDSFNRLISLFKHGGPFVAFTFRVVDLWWTYKGSNEGTSPILNKDISDIYGS
ncbi:hypothetical protein MKW98_020313 [Papaver atlanticum]|uniref:Uncharacterized protein n=1 Tax=Papaver atlanticum TaxID=357466 RepID=A0AAD4TFH2_9MAGN|nr:hypothetical protein MKW98_020313 [Papaver atlanticum]